MKLQAGDILVEVNSSNNPYQIAKRWLIGPYSHVFTYLGELTIKSYRVPMIVESVGRGVCLRSLSQRYGKEVVVMRPLWLNEKEEIKKIIRESIKLASKESAFYDYLAVVKWVIPQAILSKLHLDRLIPLRWQRDSLMICSEAIYDIYSNAGIINCWSFPENKIPMPGDFVESFNIFLKVGKGILQGEEVN